MKFVWRRSGRTLVISTDRRHAQVVADILATREDVTKMLRGCYENNCFCEINRATRCLFASKVLALRALRKAGYQPQDHETIHVVYSILSRNSIVLRYA